MRLPKSFEQAAIKMLDLYGFIILNSTYPRDIGSLFERVELCDGDGEQFDSVQQPFLIIGKLDFADVRRMADELGWDLLAGGEEKFWYKTVTD